MFVLDFKNLGQSYVERLSLQYLLSGIFKCKNNAMRQSTALFFIIYKK
jgi:hypothetical protein